MFFLNSLALSVIQWMLAIWSLVPLPFLSPAWTSGSSRFTYCWSLTWKQVLQESGKVVWYSHLFNNFPQLVEIHKVKCFSVVNEADLDSFLKFSCFFYEPLDAGILISGSSAFSKSSLNIWKILVHILLKPSLNNFEHYFASMWNECNCVITWNFFDIAFLWDWDENLLFQACGCCWVSKFAGILSAALSQHHLLGFETAQLEFHHLH